MCNLWWVTHSMYNHLLWKLMTLYLRYLASKHTCVVHCELSYVTLLVCVTWPHFISTAMHSHCQGRKLSHRLFPVTGKKYQSQWHIFRWKTFRLPYIKVDLCLVVPWVPCFCEPVVFPVSQGLPSAGLRSLSPFVGNAWWNYFARSVTQELDWTCTCLRTSWNLMNW